MPQPDNAFETDTVEVDPYHQRHFEEQQADAEYWANKENPPNPEEQNSQLEGQAEPEEVTEEDKFSDIGDVTRGVAETALQPVLGVADFASDAVGLVPWLKPVDEWWDANSYRSTHPGHKLLRDASSIIIPTLAGGSWVVGGAKSATAARAITLPKYAKTLGTIAAYTGVDTGVAMISSHSKTDDNLAGTLNNWLVWNIPWATRPGDDPDVRWKKNVFEAAGFAGGVELLGAAFTFGRKAKLFPRDAGASELINAKKTRLAEYSDPLEAAVEPRRVARDAAQVEEMIDAIKKDPSGSEYNAFVNDIGEDSAGKAVQNLEADPLEAKLTNAQIQGNIGTVHGRATSVADEAFIKQFSRAIKSNERAKNLDELFERISPNFDALVFNGAKDIQISAETMNRSVDNLTQAIYGQDVTLKQFEAIVDDMKTTVFNSNEMLDEENWVAASTAFKQAYDNLFDPNQMRASAMLAQQSADNVADAATAAKMLGDSADTSRQFEMMFEKLNLLDSEVKANRYIVNKANEYIKLKKLNNVEGTVSWLNKQAPEFDDYLKRVRTNNADLNQELISLSKQDPRYFDALKEAFFATDGDVNELHKLHTWAEKHIGVIKKGIIDGDPEVPSMVVKGLHGVRINSLLSGLAPVRAALGNSMMTGLKPASVFVGAFMSGDQAILKRAQYTYGGIAENFRRGLKVMQREWKLASQFPEEAMMRGRADMRLASLDSLTAMDTMADVWRADGENGKVAMWNMAKGLSWWNKQWFVRYGTNALYAIDGFTNSFMASGMARARAYDELFTATKGVFKDTDFVNLQRQLYDNAFDSAGLLTDEAAKHASREIALNLDNATVKKLEEFIDRVPAAKALFLFPRTGINAFELGWTFNPLSNLGPAMTKARRTLGARSAQEKLAALAEHGIDATQDADLAFQALKSEYIGRQIMGGTVVTAAGLWALEGNLTGNGPQDAGERQRMMAMGWHPKSFRDPISGKWKSYAGFEPFDSLLGLTADVIYQANRIDQAVTEDWFRKLSFSISMNLTNDTFVGGFEPLVGLLSGDPNAWTRFWAGQVDMLTPYKGMRSILNNAITPQLKDVENDIGAYLKNSHKYMFRSGKEGDPLKDLLDIYTGKPIRYHEPLNAAANAVLPMFKTNGDFEPWRQWLLSTGWDGLQKIRRNKFTRQPLSDDDRYFINNWIAKNANLKGSILRLMTEGDGFWNKKMKEYKKKRGLRNQNDFPIRQTILFKELDRIHDRAFTGAWNALEAHNDQYTTMGREIRHRNYEMNKGKYGAAQSTQQRVRDLQNIRK